jgi:hypothetical protein
MRKNTFLKAVSIFACFSILMLSVSGVIAAEKPLKGDHHSFRTIKNVMNKFVSFLPFWNLKFNGGKGDTSSDTYSKSDSKHMIKITGNLISIKRPMEDDS